MSPNDNTEGARRREHAWKNFIVKGDYKKSPDMLQIVKKGLNSVKSVRQSVKGGGEARQTDTV